MSAVGTFQTDSEGKCCYVSRRWCEFTGISRAEARANGWARILHPDDRDRVILEWSAAVGDATSFQCEYRLRAQDGTVTWILGQAVPEIGRDGVLRGYIGSITDITRQKKAEEELRRSEQRYQALADCAGVGISHLALDGSTVYLNPAMRAMLELEPDEDVRGLRYEQFFTPESSQQIRRGLGARADGLVSSYEAELVGRKGSRRTVVISGAPIPGPDGRVEGAIGTIIDVSDQQRAERALQQAHHELELRVRQRTSELERANRSLAQQVAERRKAETSLMQKASELEAVFRAFPDLYFRLASDGRILGYYAGRAYDLYAAPEQFLGKRMTEVIPPPAAGALEGALQKVIATDSLVSVEYSLPMPDGEQWFEARLVPLLEDQVAVLVREISQRKQTENALRESERHHRQAAEYNKRLVLEVDHRVRNNLAGLLSLVSLTRANARSVDAFADAIEGRLLAMSRVHDVLAATGWRAVDLGELTRSLLEALRALSRHRTTLIVDGPQVLLSPRQILPLMMVVQEWFTNSCKYGALSVPDGWLNINWELEPGSCEPGSIRIRWTESGGPTVESAVSPSLGTELIKSFVTRELRGEFLPSYPTCGADHAIVFPIDAGHQSSEAYQNSVTASFTKS
jgi:PAS domain S-box-containing protein